MTISTTTLVKVALAAVSVVFTGFAVDHLFGAASFSDDLLTMAAVGFGLAAVILP